MLIRFARHTVIVQMVALLEDLFSKEADFPVDASAHTRGLELLLENPQASVFVLTSESSDTILGMVTLQPHISTAFGCKDALLEDLVVKAEFRRKGFGSLLLRHAEKKAAISGFQRLRLVADPDNSLALSFYRKAGWVQGCMVPFFRSLT